jgi:hypothetical protein
MTFFFLTLHQDIAESAKLFYNCGVVSLNLDDLERAVCFFGSLCIIF